MPKRTRHTGPSSRPTQVGEQIRQFLSQQLLEGAIHDPRLKAANLVTVTEVRMSPDLRSAQALVSIYPEDEDIIAEVFSGLVSATNEIKRSIGRTLRLRFTPDLRFRLDDSIAYGAKIEALLKEIQASEDGLDDESPDEEPGPKPGADG